RRTRGRARQPARSARTARRSGAPRSLAHLRIGRSDDVRMSRAGASLSAPGCGSARRPRPLAGAGERGRTRAGIARRRRARLASLPGRAPGRRSFASPARLGAALLALGAGRDPCAISPRSSPPGGPGGVHPRGRAPPRPRGGRGEWTGAEPAYDEALAASRASGNRETECRALVGLGKIYNLRGRHEQVLGMAERGLALAADLPLEIGVKLLQMKAGAHFY